MPYIIFKNHPADLIKHYHKSNKLKSFLAIGNKFCPIEKISYNGGERFIIYCKFSSNKIEQEYVLSKLTEMQADGEIFEFKL